MERKRLSELFFFENFMMPPTGIPNTMLTTPNSEEASGSGMSSPPQIPGAPVRLSRLTFEDVVDRNRSMMLREGHMKRLKNLKKEVDYIQETAWKYPPIETFIGH